MFKLKDIKDKAMGFLQGYEKKDPATLAAAEQAVGGLLVVDGLVGIRNPFGGGKRSGIFGSFVGVLFGLALLIFGGFVFSLIGTENLTVNTTGNIVEISHNHTTDSDGNTSEVCGLKVAYTANGQDYSVYTDSESSKNCQETVGANIDIRYNPNHAGTFDTVRSIKTTNTIRKITPFVGLIIFIVCGVTFLIRLLSIIYGWKILKRGRKLAKTLPNGGGLKSQISQIRQEFKQMFLK